MSWSWSRRLSETVQSQERKSPKSEVGNVFCRKMLNYISRKKRKTEDEI